MARVTLTLSNVELLALTPRWNGIFAWQLHISEVLPFNACKREKALGGSESLPANWAATATDANPIVILFVRLLAAATVADDRIPITCRASPQDLVAVPGPISFKLVR